MLNMRTSSAGPVVGVIPVVTKGVERWHNDARCGKRP